MSFSHFKKRTAFYAGEAWCTVCNAFESAAYRGVMGLLSLANRFR